MFGKQFKLFSLFGFSVKIDLSWFIIVALVAWSLADGWFIDPQRYPTLVHDARLRWTMGIAGAAGLFISIVLHEFGHSLMARRLGLPMRGITLFIFGGVAEMGGEPATPWVEFLMTIAGPIVSLVVAGAFYLAARGPWPLPVHAVLLWLAFINAILVAFNLIPAFPLDGGRMLRAVLWAWKGNLRWATRIASSIGAGFGIVMIVLGVVSVLTGNVVGGMWWFILGLFLHAAAKGSYQQLLIRKALEGEPVRQFMKPDPQVVRPDITLESLAQDYIYRYHYKMFPVLEVGRLIGCITTQQLKEVPRDHWAAETVGQHTVPCSDQNTIGPDADALEALTTMNRTGRSRLLVVHHGHLAGILALKDLMGFLSLKIELGDVAAG